MVTSPIIMGSPVRRHTNPITRCWDQPHYRYAGTDDGRGTDQKLDTKRLTLMMGFAVSTGRRGQSEGRPRQVMGVMTCTTRADQGKAEGGAHATLGRCSKART